MSHYAVYSKSRKKVICRFKKGRGVSSTRSYRILVDSLEALTTVEIRVLKTFKGQEVYLKRVNSICTAEFEIVETNEKGIPLK